MTEIGLILYLVEELGTKMTQNIVLRKYLVCDRYHQHHPYEH